MDNRHNYVKDFDPQFQFLDQFLRSSVCSQQITKLLNLPLNVYRKETLTAPFFTIVSFPNSSYQNYDRIEYKHRHNFHKQEKERRQMLNVSTTCLGNINYKSEDPLVLECSSTSLNLESGGNNNVESPYQTPRLFVCEKKYLEKPKVTESSPVDNLAVFTFSKEEAENIPLGGSNSLTLLSTSSSGSSTKEYYLPANTGSNDTIKVADVLNFENEIYSSQLPNRPLKDDVNNWLSNALKSSENQKHIEQNSSGYSLCPPELVYNGGNVTVSQNLKKRNPVLPGYQEMKENSIVNKGLSVVVHNRDTQFPLIGLNKLYDEVLLNFQMKGIKEDSSHFLRDRPIHNDVYSNKKNEKNMIKSERTPKVLNINRSLPVTKLPSPLDWVKEMEEHKFILEQDIIENESLISSQSNHSTLCLNNKDTTINNSKTPNRKAIISSENKVSKKSEIHSEKTEFNADSINTVNTSCTNTLESERNISIQNKDKEGKNVNNAKTELKRLSNRPVISSPCIPEKKARDLENNSSKFKKLTGFFDPTSQKPFITKLFIQSDVIVEGSGNDSEDEMVTTRVKARKLRPLQKRFNKEKLAPEEYGEIELQSVLHQLSEGDKLKNTFMPQKSKEHLSNINVNNNPEDAYIYSESLITNFQKLREKFALHNKTDDRTVMYGSKVQENPDIYEGKKEIPICETGHKEECKKVISEPAAEESKPIEIETNDFSLIDDLEKDVTKKENIGEQGMQQIVNRAEPDELCGQPEFKSKQGRVLLKCKQPMLLYDKTGFPNTDLKGRFLKNNRGFPILNVKNYEDVINKDMTVYDADRVSVNDSGFDPSKKPKITTYAKVTDQVGNPVSLYNNIGMPLTDEDGLLLHDSNGEILVTLDSRFFPLCCKNGTSIYLRNGSTWLSQRYKYIVTTQNKAIPNIRSLEKQTKSKDDLGKDEMNTKYKSFTHINSSSSNIPYSINNSMGTKSVSTQYDNENELMNFYMINETDNNPHYEKVSINKESNRKQRTASSEFILQLLYNKLLKKKSVSFSENNEKINDERFKSDVHVYDIQGRRLTDKFGYPLCNQYREPLLLFDKYGWPISDCCGRAIFNSKGEQLLGKQEYIYQKTLNYFSTEGRKQNQKYSRYLQPERPYCELPEESIPDSLPTDVFGCPSTSQVEPRPLMRMIDEKCIRAWGLNEVPSPVKSVYSLSSKNCSNLDNHKSALYSQINGGRKFYEKVRQKEKINHSEDYYTANSQQFYEGYDPSVEYDNQYEHESTDEYEDIFPYVDDKNDQVGFNSLAYCKFVKDPYCQENLFY